MNRLPRFAYLAAACVCAFAASAAQYQGPDRTRLNIGAYYLRVPAGIEERHVLTAKECGINFIHDYWKGAEICDLYVKHGIKGELTFVLPSPPRKDKETGRILEGDDFEKACPLSKFDKAIDNFRKSGRVHPFVESIAVVDEPSARMLPYYGKVAARCRKLLPEVAIYICLFPKYGEHCGMKGKVVNLLGGVDTYEEYIDMYCRHVPADSIVYDFYLYSGAMLSDFYDNMRIVSDACRKTGRVHGIVLQAASGRSREDVNDIGANKLRYQANAALAFGVETILWATYSPGWWTNACVLAANGEKTVQYERLKTVNAELHRVGPDYMRFRNTATHYVGFPEGCDDLKGVPVKSFASLDTGYFQNVRAEDGDRLVIGQMVERVPSGREAVALFVCAADDPYDTDCKKRKIVFKPGEGRRVKVVGGNGELPVAVAEDGTMSFEIASSGGALVISESAL